jgi:ferric-dicitrate binding protein FerR (iron transport regulator)
MPDHQERIAYLLARYVNKSISREELNELFAAIRQEEHQELLERFMEDTWHAAHTAPEIDYNDIYEQIMPQQARWRTRVITWRRTAIAATMLLLIGVAGWMLIPRSEQQQPRIVQETTPAVILPGSNRALLTLADGTTIPLDSVGKQVIQQGGVAIRQQNGQLLYANQGTSDHVHYNKLTTPRGGQFTLVLPDGTQVWLNSASSLRYPTAFRGKDRIVELEGQGYFEVTANADQPFKVIVRNMEVQVLGTGFDIMAYPDETTVNTTLLTGSVQVKAGPAQQLLHPGQQAVLDNQDQHISVKTADVKKVTAWKNGLFVFNNMALPAILREVARWYDVEIVYTATPGAELYGGGIGRNLQLAGVLALLEGNGYNHFKIEGRKVIVLP